jgi:hypothetical protein
VLLKLVFSNNQTADLIIDDSPIGGVYQQIYKHLSKAELVFKPRDNPYYVDMVTHEQIVKDLQRFAKQLNIEIDVELALQKDQQHLNHLHEIYETQYDGDPAWLDFHENLHLCEMFRFRNTSLMIDYRNRAGPLERSMKEEWLTALTTKLSAGDLYVFWSELGKTPFNYWQSKEPNDITRICELAKPWLKLRPRIYVALEDIDLMSALNDVDIEQFETWWSQYRTDWETHWGVSDYTLERMFGVLKLGTTSHYENIQQQLRNKSYPVKTVYIA